MVVTFAGVGRVEEDELERRLMFGFQFADGFECVGFHDANVAGDGECSEIFGDQACRGGMILRENNVRRAAADGFDPDSAGSGEKIQKARAIDGWAENIEESFAEHVTGGTNLQFLEREQVSGAECAGDDAHGQLNLVTRSEPDGSGAATRREAPAGSAVIRSSVWHLRRARRLPCGHFPKIRGREEGWQRESRFRRTGGCRKIRRGHAAASRFQRFRNRWKYGPSFPGGCVRRRSCEWAKRGCNGIFERRGRCARATDVTAKDRIV